MTAKQFCAFARLPNSFTAAADVLAGAALAGAVLDLRLAIAAVGAMALYCGGIILNDAFDAAKDETLHPERAIPSRLIGVRGATILGITLLLVGFAPACWDPARLPLQLALVLCIVLYDIVPERWTIAALLLMASCRTLNLASGLMLSATAWPREATAALVTQALLIATLTSASQQEGTGRTIKVQAFIIEKAFWVPGVLMLLREANTAAFLCTLCGGILGVTAIIPARTNTPSPAKVVRNTLLLLIPLSALWAWSAGAWVALACIAVLWPTQVILRWCLAFKAS